MTIPVEYTIPMKTNPDKYNLEQTYNATKALSGDASQVPTPITSPFPDAWKGDTTERVNFETALGLRVADLARWFEETLGVIGEAWEEEPVEIPDYRFPGPGPYGPLGPH